MNEETFILTLTSLLELVSLIEKLKGSKCVNSNFLPQIESKFENVHLILYNKTHLITSYQQIENKTFVSFEKIFKCITPVFNNYTNMWVSFKNNFDENFITQKETNDHFFQPEVQSIVLISSILILFALIFGLTIICQKSNTNEPNSNDSNHENNRFLPVSNTNESLDSTNEREMPLNFKNSKWYSRVFRKKATQNNEINEMSFVSVAHLVNVN